MFTKLPPELVSQLAIVFVVVFGAVVHATAQLKISRDKKVEFTKTDFFILFIIASFSGMIFGLTSMLFFHNQIAIILFSAIGAFLGIAGLNKLSIVLLDILQYWISKHDGNKD